MSRLLGSSFALLVLMPSVKAQAGSTSITPETPPMLRQIPPVAVPGRPYLTFYRFGYDAALVTRSGDFDRDGDPDVIIGPLSGVPPRLLLNDGNGRLTEVTDTHMPNLTTNIVMQGMTVDLDGDGDLDFLGANYSSNYLSGLWLPATILDNDGTGHFTDVSAQRGIIASYSHPYIFSSSCAAADFDGDGDVDIVLSGGGIAGLGRLSCRLWRNDGSGRFAYDASGFPNDPGYRADELGDLLSADLDGDGDIDLASPGTANGMALWINDGTGHFTDATTTNLHPAPSQYVFRTVALGDVDGDGDLDIAASRCCVLDVPFLFLNDGRGQFLEVSATQMPSNSDSGDSLQFADFDDDGDLDLLSVIRPNHITRFPGEEQLLLNNGWGWFTLDAERRFFGTNPNGYVADLVTEDFDADGDVDVIYGSNIAQPTPPQRLPYYLNTHRHTYAPDPPRRGATWRVKLCGPVASTGVLAIAFAPGGTPIPSLGRLGLDPGTLQLWPTAVTIRNEREAPIDVPISNLPLLLGMPIYVQGLLNEPQRGWRLTNVWVEDAIR
ncbi:MAG: VCBS repeat-containing protein [Planctomycetes bacterium]|nr:VCBS repeat-containing protein [Planctomycetota bacterium]